MAVNLAARSPPRTLVPGTLRTELRQVPGAGDPDLQSPEDTVGGAPEEQRGLSAPTSLRHPQHPHGSPGFPVPTRVPSEAEPRRLDNLHSPRRPQPPAASTLHGHSPGSSLLHPHTPSRSAGQRAPVRSDPGPHRFPIHSPRVPLATPAPSVQARASLPSPPRNAPPRVLPRRTLPAGHLPGRLLRPPGTEQRPECPPARSLRPGAACAPAGPHRPQLSQPLPLGLPGPAGPSS